MEAKTEIKKEIVLRPCRCGDQRPIVAKIQPGRWVTACRCCPTRALGGTERDARKNWNKERVKDACTRKRN